MSQKYYLEAYTYDVLQLEGAKELARLLHLESKAIKKEVKDLSCSNLAELGELDERNSLMLYLTILCYLTYVKFNDTTLITNGSYISGTFSYESICSVVIPGLMKARNFPSWHYTNLYVDDYGALHAKDIKFVSQKDIHTAYDAFAKYLSYRDDSTYGRILGVQPFTYYPSDSVTLSVGEVFNMLKKYYDKDEDCIYTDPNITSEVEINYV